MSALTAETWDNIRANKDRPETQERLRALVLSWEQLVAAYTASRVKVMDQREKALSQIRQCDAMLENSGKSIASLTEEIGIAQNILADGTGQIDA